MISVIGWIALALGGAWVIGALVMFISTGAGLRGLESLPLALLLAGVSAVAWIALVIGWSPLTVGMN